MRQYFQLQIPTPCHENWDAMRPGEKGRFCASCSKTVIDFTNLADQEMIRILARAGQGACGRFAPDQLNRSLTLPEPAKKTTWRGWPLILAGLLAAIRLPAQTRPAKQVTTQSLGHPSPIRQQIVSILAQDSINKAAADSFKVLPPVIVVGYSPKSFVCFAGGISIGRVIKTENWKQTLKDTLIAIHLLPQKELTVYPNPVQRGAVISLSWQTEPGSYEVTLHNSSGMLIRRQVVNVGNFGQTDLMEVPSSLAAGVYFLRASRAGQKKPLTREIVIR
jgi:hypothetical protein